MKKLLYLVLPFLAAPALAQQQPFESNGPAGGQARAFRAENGRVFVAGRGGVYERRSNIWTPLNQQWGDLSCARLASIHATNLNMIAGTLENGVYLSGNSGSSWTNVTGDLATGRPYTSVAVALQNYLAVRGDVGNLYTSTDGGKSWVLKNPFFGNFKVGYLTVYANDVYASSSGGLLKSVDNGQSFMMHNADPALDGKMLWKNDTLWVAGKNGIRRSLDQGMSFEPPLLSGRTVGSIAVSGNYILATVAGTTGVDTVKYSNNSGTTFSNLMPGTAFRFTNAYDLASDAGYFLVGTDQGIFYGNVNNTGWRSDDSGYRARRIAHLGTGPAGTIYATATEEGSFQTADSGASWTPSASAANGAENMIQAADGNGLFVYAAGAGNFYRSTNGGASFTAGATGLTAGTYSSVAVQKSTGAVMVVRNGDVYRSTDNGVTFTMLSTGIPSGGARQVSVADTSWFIMGANDSLYQAGSNLQFRNATGVWGGITGVTHNTRAYYASTRTESLFQSTDGHTWTSVPHAGTIPMQLNAIAAVDTAVYIGTDYGLLSNRSGSWDMDSLGGQIIYALAVNNKKLYAGTCNGVWAARNLPTPPPVDTGLSVNGIGRATVALRLYPNPAGGDFNAAFSSPEAGSATLTLSDLTGRSVYAAPASIQAGRNTLRIPAAALQLSSGVYFLKVQTRNSQGVQRILIRAQ